MEGNMFDIVFPGWFLRPGPLNLDVFCPVCGAFPLHYDPHTPGGNAVGKNLSIQGPDGRPVVLTVKQILMGANPAQVIDKAVQPVKQSSHTPMIEPPGICPDCKGVLHETHVCKPQEVAATPNKEFPCPYCGAKKRFHKKGCDLQMAKATGEFIKSFPKDAPPIIQPINYGPKTDKHAKYFERLDRQKAQDPFVAALAGSVSGKRGDTGEGPPTPEELAEVLADREARRIEGDSRDDLRPGEGYMPQQVR